MPSPEIKLPTPSIVRSVGDTVVANVGDAVLIAPSESTLGQDLMLLAQTTEQPADAANLLVGQSSIEVRKAQPQAAPIQVTSADISAAGNPATGMDGEA
jgi:uncharacterized lipoprotein YbaY